MLALGGLSRNLNRTQRHQLVLGAALLLVLGLGSFAGINHWLAAWPMIAGLTFCAIVLIVIAIAIALSRRLRHARAQRDWALARASAMERQMSDVLRNQDLRVEQRVAKRVQELQTNIESLRAREQLLRVQAHHDGLTGLANRILLTDRFRFAVERAKRSAQSFALLMIDLNDFKSINDNYGHAAGDAVLITMARRLVGAVRASDTVARLGGDEFVLIIESFEDMGELRHIGQKLIDTLSHSIALDSDVVVKVGASVGVALYPDHGVDMNHLLYVADQAMYDCKSSRQMTLQ
jgi:diguanylate cyclase (GGDEF)-like protein